MEQDNIIGKYVEFKYCECGCKKTVSKYILGENGRVRKDKPEQRYKVGHQGRGKKWKSPHNKGYRFKHKQGYVYVVCRDHPRGWKKTSYVGEHVLVMEKHIGRYLKKGEHVHHINGNRDDNRIENLKLVTNSEHMKYHMIEYWKKRSRNER